MFLLLWGDTECLERCLLNKMNYYYIFWEMQALLTAFHHCLSTGDKDEPVRKDCGRNLIMISCAICTDHHTQQRWKEVEVLPVYQLCWETREARAFSPDQVNKRLADVRRQLSLLCLSLSIGTSHVKEIVLYLLELPQELFIMRCVRLQRRKTHFSWATEIEQQWGPFCLSFCMAAHSIVTGTVSQDTEFWSQCL